jgi:hypothetical protein
MGGCEYDSACQMLYYDYLHSLPFDPDDGRSTFLRNIYELLPGYTVLYARR